MVFSRVSRTGGQAKKGSPLASRWAVGSPSVTMSSVVDTLRDHYFSTNYDAWANIYTTVEMVGRQGIHWGQQLLGGILFFVPSALWHAKPLATGIAIGNYLIANYSMWFTNLSAPLVAEGYIDFGAIGVALYAIAWRRQISRTHCMML